MSQNVQELIKPTLDEIIKEYPPTNSFEDYELEYADDDEEEECDLLFSLLPFEEKYYDEEGNFYPDGYKDEKGDILV